MSRTGQQQKYFCRSVNCQRCHSWGGRRRKGWVWTQTGRPNPWVGSYGSSLSSSRSFQTPWNYTVPFHWEAMSSYVLPWSEYCNAMSNFYQSDSLSLWHCCDILSGIISKVRAHQLKDLPVLLCRVQSPRGHKWGTVRHGGVAELRDRPFILKGLFVSNLTLGNRVQARCQGIKAQFVLQAFIFI